MKRDDAYYIEHVVERTAMDVIYNEILPSRKPMSDRSVAIEKQIKEVDALQARMDADKRARMAAAEQAKKIAWQFNIPHPELKQRIALNAALPKAKGEYVSFNINRQTGEFVALNDAKGSESARFQVNRDDGSLTALSDIGYRDSVSDTNTIKLGMPDPDVLASIAHLLGVDAAEIAKKMRERQNNG
jgi:hypothetical protein